MSNVVNIKGEPVEQNPIKERKQYTDQVVVWMVFGIGVGFLFSGLFVGSWFCVIFGLVLGWVGWIK